MLITETKTTAKTKTKTKTKTNCWPPEPTQQWFLLGDDAPRCSRRGRLHDCLHNCMIACMCITAWLHNCMIACMCLIAWLPDYFTPQLPNCIFALLLNCTIIYLPNWIFAWLKRCLERGERRWRLTEHAPADSPIRVMLFGFPPGFWLWLFYFSQLQYCWYQIGRMTMWVFPTKLFNVVFHPLQSHQLVKHPWKLF